MDWSVNFLGVLIAAIACMILGALWYGPFFGKEWMKLVGLTKKSIASPKKSGMWKNYLLDFIATFITAYILALSLKYLRPSSIMTAITIGLLIWIGFIAAISVSTLLWQRRNPKLYIIENGYRLVCIVVMSIILYFIK